MNVIFHCNQNCYYIYISFLLLLLLKFLQMYLRNLLLTNDTIDLGHPVYRIFTFRANVRVERGKLNRKVFHCFPIFTIIIEILI